MSEHEHGGPADGLWLTITELAKRKRRGKASISERVTRLEADGLLHPRPGTGRSKLVNVAEYDRAVGEVGDPAKEAAAASRAEDAGAAGETGRDPKYRDAKANEAHYAAELKRLEFEERTGKLLPLGDVLAAAEQCRSVIASAIDRLSLRASEMVGAVDKEREVGARRVFRDAAFDLRKTAADALTQLATVGRNSSDHSAFGGRAIEGDRERSDDEQES